MARAIEVFVNNSEQLKSLEKLVFYFFIYFFFYFQGGDDPQPNAVFSDNTPDPLALDFDGSSRQ